MAGENCQTTESFAELIPGVIQIWPLEQAKYSGSLNTGEGEQGIVLLITASIYVSKIFCESKTGRRLFLPLNVALMFHDEQVSGNIIVSVYKHLCKPGRVPF